jgi:hypothetical protein
MSTASSAGTRQLNPVLFAVLGSSDMHIAHMFGVAHEPELAHVPDTNVERATLGDGPVVGAYCNPMYFIRHHHVFWVFCRHYAVQTTRQNQGSPRSHYCTPLRSWRTHKPCVCPHSWDGCTQRCWSSRIPPLVPTQALCAQWKERDSECPSGGVGQRSW